MAEKRRSKRRQLFFRLEVVDPASGERLGHLVDVTAEGMLLLSARPHERGARLAFEVKLPDVPEFRGDRLAGSAHVRWSGSDQNPSLHCAGLQFDALDPKSQGVVDVLVARFGFSGA